MTSHRLADFPRIPSNTEFPTGARGKDRQARHTRRVPKNVLGGELELCSSEPLTGFARSGCCEVHSSDTGFHIVCAVVTNSFLAFSKEEGNDLTTPRPEYGFPGLKAGDRWCLCASRWVDAFEAGVAPKVVLEATSANALEWIDIGDLRANAV